MPDLQVLDEVMTEDGKGIIVGFPEGRVEVRYLQRGGQLHIWGYDEVTPIATPEAVAEYEQARGQGVNLTVPEEAKEFQAQAEGMAVAQGQVRLDANGNPLSKTGKPLHGVARRNALARLARDQ